jgi:hypothetical protein
MMRLLFLGLLLLLTACGAAAPGEPRARVNLGDERARYTFDEPTAAWDIFSLGGDQAVFRLGDDALEGAVIADRGYIWSLEGNRYNDVAVQAAVQQTQGARGNGFGLMCRADEQGNGYYFVISSARQFAILKAVPEEDNPIWMVGWESHPAISEDKPNTLEAVCAGDYLRFSVNGQFLADLRDSTFSVGQVGVALGAIEETLWVRFDDIIIRAAQLVG